MFIFMILMLERRENMKSTGIVRRIDELGRIVIPKEIRKTLKIREGDNLEIYVEKGSIILCKFSHLNSLTSIANKITSIVSPMIRRNILVVDLDHVISCSKSIESDYLNQSISNQLIKLILNRKNYAQYSLENISFIPLVSTQSSYVICPILADSDILGAVILFDSKPLNEADFIVGEILSSFMVKEVEE